jgi:pyruvate dehydrogenase E1 component beta subunit
MISKSFFRNLRRFSTSQDVGNKITIREAINRALEQEMRRDKNIFIIGEEVGQYQGAYKVTKGLLEKFGPERIVDTPIT